MRCITKPSQPKAMVGAPYIDGTGLEGGSLTLSLAFMGLALERLAANVPKSLQGLSRTVGQTISGIGVLVRDAKNLANR